MAKRPSDYLNSTSSNTTVQQTTDKSKGRTPSEFLNNPNSTVVDKILNYNPDIKGFGSSKNYQGLLSDSNPYAVRAANQGAWDEFANSLVQTGANIIGSGLESVSNTLGLIPGVDETINSIAKSEQLFGNALTDYISNQTQEFNQNIVPVYNNPLANDKSEWVYENLPSLGTSIGMLLPTLGVIKGLGALGRATKGYNIYKKSLAAAGILEGSEAFNAITSGIEATTAAGISRHSESLMEGAEAGDEAYNKALANGSTEEEANLAKLQAAQDTYSKNWRLIGLDLLQFGTAFKSFKNASIAANNLERELAKKGLGSTLKTVGTQMGTESIEEGLQLIIAKESVRDALINHGREQEDYSTLPQRLLNYVAGEYSDEFWTSAVFGALGGGVFEGIASKQEFDNDKRQKLVQNQLKTATEQQKAAFLKDPIEFKKKGNESLYVMMANAVQNGRAEDIANMFDAAKQTANSNPETSDELNSIADNGLKKLKELSTFYDKIAPTSTPEVTRMYLSNKINNFLLTEENTALQEKLQKEILDLSNNNGIDSITTSLIQADLQLKALDQLEKDFKSAKNPINENIIKQKKDQLVLAISTFRDTIKTNNPTLDIDEKISKIDKSQISSTIYIKTASDLKLEQNSEDFSEINTAKGKSKLNDALLKSKELSDKTSYTNLTKQISPNLDEATLTKLREESKKLNKSKEFETELDTYIKKLSTTPVDTSNLAQNLKNRYTNNNLLKSKEIPALHKKAMTTGGIPEETEFNEEGIATLYSTNPKFAKEVDKYFGVINTGKVTTKTDNEIPTALVESSSNILINVPKNYTWASQGIQYKYENGEFIKDEEGNFVLNNSSLTKKINWNEINAGNIPVGSTLNYEYDYNDKWYEPLNIKQSIDNFLVEIVYYKDSNSDNKIEGNRIIVGALSSYTSKKDASLKQLRENLYNELKSKPKFGIQTFNQTTRLKKYYQGQFNKLRQTPKNNPHKLLKENEKFWIGITTYRNNQIVLEAPGIQEKLTNIGAYASIGHPYIIILNPATQEYIPYSLFTEKIKTQPNVLESVINDIQSLQQDSSAKHTKEIVSKLHDTLFLRSLVYTKGTYIIQTGDAKKPVVITFTNDNIKEVIGELVFKVDINKINKGDYNTNLSKNNRITTDLHPTDRFHSVNVEIEPYNTSIIPDKIAIVSLESTTTNLDPTKTKVNVKTPSKISGVGSIKINLGKGNEDGKFSLEQKDEQGFSTLNVEEFKKWMNKNLPQVPAEITDNLIEVYKNGGTKAWGMFKNALIKVYKNSPSGTGYHEAGHAVFNLFLTNVEQEQLLNEEAEKLKINRGKDILTEPIDFSNTSFEIEVIAYTQNENKFYKRVPVNETRTEWQEIEISEDEYKTALNKYKEENPTKLTKPVEDIYNTNDLRLEESIMNKFAVYIENDGKVEGLPYYINKFFKKIYQLIKSLFTDNINIDDFFERINTGYYKNKPLPNKSTDSRYSVMNLNPLEIKEAVKTINYQFFSVLEEFKNANKLTTSNDIQVLKEISKTRFNGSIEQALLGVYGQVYNGLIDATQDIISKYGDFTQAQKLNTLIENLFVITDNEITGTGSLYGAALQDLKNYGINIKDYQKKINIDENLDQLSFEELYNNDFEIADDEDKETSYNEKSLERNPKDQLHQEVKKVLQQLEKYSYDPSASEEEQFYQEDDSLNNVFGQKTFVEYDEVVNYLHLNLNSNSISYDIDEMMFKLNELKYSRPEIYGLIKKLETNSIIKDQFFSDFSLGYFPSFIVEQEITKEQYDKDNFYFKTNIKFYNANRTNTSKLIVDEWNNNLLDSNRNTILNSNQQINKQYAKELFNDYIKIINEIKSLKNITPTIASNLSANLNNFGITIDSQVFLNEFVEKKQYKAETLTPLQNLMLLLDGITSIKTILSSITVGNNPYEGNNVESTSIKNVTSKVAKNSSNIHQDLSINAEGKKEYAYGFPTFLHKKVGDYLTKDKRESYLNNWWFSKNKWLQQLDEDANSKLKDLFRVGIFNGFIPNNQDGVKFFKLTNAQLAISDINIYNNYGSDIAYYRLPLLSDSSQAFILPMVKFNKREILDNIYELTLTEIERFEKINNLSINIKNFKIQGKIFNIVTDLNDVSVDTLNDETKIREIISNWFDRNFNQEIERLKDEEILNNKGDFNLSISDNQKKTTIEGFSTKFEEYFYNKVLANISLIQLTSVDTSFYKKDDNSIYSYGDFYKRNGQNSKSTRMLNTKASYKGITVGEQFKAVYIIDEEGDIVKELKEAILSAFKEQGANNLDLSIIKAGFSDVNQTDSQTFISPLRKKKVEIGFGNWNDTIENAFRDVTKNKKWDNISGTLFQVEKPFYYNHHTINDVFIPTQIKNSEVMLSKQYVGNNSKLKAIWNLMENHEVESVIFTSAVKTGNFAASSIEDIVEGKIPYIHTFDNKYYGRQNEIPSKHIEKEILFGSQLKALITADIPADATFFKGKYNKQEVFNLFQNLLADNIKESYNEVASIYNNIEALQKALLEQVNALGLGNEYIKALEIVDGQFRVPLYDPMFSDKMQQILNSIIRNNITKQKMNGASLVNMSSFGLSDDLQIVVDEKGVKYYEVLLPSWSKNKFPRKPNGEVDIEYLEKHSPELLDLFGYRIPTEYKYSMKRFKVKGFTPDYMGGVIVLPTAITKIAGEDFDKDVTYIFIPNFEEKNGNLQKIKYNFKKLIEEKEIKLTLNNTIISDENLEKTIKIKSIDPLNNEEFEEEVLVKDAINDLKTQQNKIQDLLKCLTK